MKKIIKFLNNFKRPCDEIILSQINDIYKTMNVNKFERWHLIERLRQIPHQFIENQIPKYGKILDIGIGRGGFAVYMGLKQKKRYITGFDTDKIRINAAKKINSMLPNVFFDTYNLDYYIEKDIKFDVITVMDILHHNSYLEQEKIISDFNKILNENGTVIMLEAGDKPFLRYWGIWFIDYILYPFSETCKYRTENDWKNLYLKNGFENINTFHITDRGLFFTRKLMIFKKVS